MATKKLDLNLVRGELARRGLRQLDVAGSLGLPLSTFSGYLHGMYPAPDFAAEVERSLGVPVGALSTGAER